MMGFSVIPPKPNIRIAVRSMEVWTQRADAAIMHLDVPWALLLAGTSPEETLRRDGVDLEHYYRSKHLVLVVTIDVTNGLGRESEAAALVTARRSITEPAVQRCIRTIWGWLRRPISFARLHRGRFTTRSCGSRTTRPPTFGGNTLRARYLCT